jgi:hypothetical protein
MIRPFQATGRDFIVGDLHGCRFWLDSIGERRI